MIWLLIILVDNALSRDSESKEVEKSLYNPG